MHYILVTKYAAINMRMQRKRFYAAGKFIPISNN